MDKIETWKELYLFLKGIATGSGIILVDNTECYGAAFYIRNQPKYILGYISLIDRRRLSNYRIRAMVLGHELGHLVKLDSRSNKNITVTTARSESGNEEEANKFFLDLLELTDIQVPKREMTQINKALNGAVEYAAAREASYYD